MKLPNPPKQPSVNATLAQWEDHADQLHRWIQVRKNIESYVSAKANIRRGAKMKFEYIVTTPKGHESAFDRLENATLAAVGIYGKKKYKKYIRKSPKK